MSEKYEQILGGGLVAFDEKHGITFKFKSLSEMQSFRERCLKTLKNEEISSRDKLNIYVNFYQQI